MNQQKQSIKKTCPCSFLLFDLVGTGRVKISKKDLNGIIIILFKRRSPATPPPPHRPRHPIRDHAPVVPRERLADPGPVLAFAHRPKPQGGNAVPGHFHFNLENLSSRSPPPEGDKALSIVKGHPRAHAFFLASNPWPLFFPHAHRLAALAHVMSTAHGRAECPSCPRLEAQVLSSRAAACRGKRHAMGRLRYLAPQSVSARPPFVHPHPRPTPTCHAPRGLAWRARGGVEGWARAWICGAGDINTQKAVASCVSFCSGPQRGRGPTHPTHTHTHTQRLLTKLPYTLPIQARAPSLSTHTRCPSTGRERRGGPTADQPQVTMRSH